VQGTGLQTGLQFGDVCSDAAKAAQKLASKKEDGRTLQVRTLSMSWRTVSALWRRTPRITSPPQSEWTPSESEGHGGDTAAVAVLRLHL
jgi:hypothetical protein